MSKKGDSSSYFTCIVLVSLKLYPKEHNSAFRPFVLPKPFTSIKDIFCIKESRIVNGYGQISFRHRYLEIPKHVPEGARIMVHLYDDPQKPEIRLWYKEVLVQVIVLGPKN